MRTMMLLMISISMLCSGIAQAETAEVSTCFTPRENCGSQLLDLIHSAKHSIYMQTYSFTLYTIAHALVEMKNKGVDVQVIMDKSQFQCDQFSQAKYLVQQGIPVFDDNQLNIAHSKVIIVDGTRVETGSFNYTSSAEHYNAENLVIINSTGIAAAYTQNWQWRLSQSTRVSLEDLCMEKLSK